MLDCLCGIMLAEAMQLFDCQFIWIIFAWQNIFNTWFNAYLLAQLGQTPLPHNLVFAVHLHLHHEHLNLIFNLSCQVKSSKIPILKSSATFFFFLNTYSNSYSIPDWSVPLNIKMNEHNKYCIFILSNSLEDGTTNIFTILYCMQWVFFFIELHVQLILSVIIYLPSALFSCMPAIQLALLSFWLRCVQQFPSKP